MSLKIVIFANSLGWHERVLVEAFKSENIDASVVSLANCQFCDRKLFGGLTIPGFEDSLPHAAFVRGIAAGSFEEVTLRLDVLHALGEMTVKVINPARVIERTVDKAMTSHLLNRQQVPSVPAWTFTSQEAALEHIDKLCKREFQLVLKPLFGSRGRGLKLIESVTDLPDEESVNGVYYLQKFIRSKYEFSRDWRVMVINGKAVSAMERRSENWITNRAQGATCLPAQLSSEVLQIAEDATKAVGADYAGIDIICTENGQWLVLEVNGVPAWYGLQEVTDKSIAKLFAQLVLILMR